MRNARNPFRLRRSESIDAESDFINLFEPGVLDVFGVGEASATVRVIRSASGGGKTSLLRLFTPRVLLKVHARRRSEDRVREVHQRLVDLGVMGDQGPKLLGVQLLCGQNYAILHHLPIDVARKARLFFGLLNARIVLAVLRSALAMKSLEYPADLSRVQVGLRPGQDPPSGINLPCAGTTLHDWARRNEKAVCSALDSFGPMDLSTLPGSDGLFALSVLAPDLLHVDGSPVAERLVLMLDDVQSLSPDQRALLIKHVIEARSNVGVWIAERFEALSTTDMLASGSREGRDHEAPIEVEKFWRLKFLRFEKNAMQLAQKRTMESDDADLGSFAACLEANLDGPEYEATFVRATTEVSARVRERVGKTGRFQEWVESRDRADGSPREQAIAWRALEILIERELRKPQKGLFDDSALEEEELKVKDDSSVNNAAELFLAREYRLPYYFGPERIARLGALNIQQFLDLAGDMFEEIISAKLLRGGSTVLSARRQDAIVRTVAERLWTDIPNGVRHGRLLRNLLESIGQWCEWYTYRPNAPNDPGVGGTAIRMSDRAHLLETEGAKLPPEQSRFAEVLASGLAHNYLVADLDYKCKGNRWMVLNLNRLLCAKFGLPLGYGLYKERSLADLCRWVDQPFTPPRTPESLLS